MNFVKQTINILLDILVVLIFIRVIFSWFRMSGGLTRFLYETTEPILAPIRRALPHLGMIDISPLVAILLIEVLRTLLNSFL